MPGLITHHKILHDCIQYLSTKKKKRYVTRSIEILFNGRGNRAAGFFGAMGPDMFDCIPVGFGKGLSGAQLSYFFHNGGGDRFLREMIDALNRNSDNNNEWAAMQRAYLYGYVSHVIADAVINPFIYYFSGFPDSGDRKEHTFFREQNLLFQYHLDSYFMHYDEGARERAWTIEQMMALDHTSIPRQLAQPVRHYILDSMRKAEPEIFSKLILYRKDEGSEDGALPRVISYIDMLPQLLPLIYRLKMSRNRVLHDRVRDIRRRGWIYSDLLVLYPLPKKTNRNILNAHRERWQLPTGKPGYHYDSVIQLAAIAVEKIVDLWERLETSLFARPDNKVIDELLINLYTGDRSLTYTDMKIKSPIRLGV